MIENATSVQILYNQKLLLLLSVIILRYILNTKPENYMKQMKMEHCGILEMYVLVHFGGIIVNGTYVV